MPTQATSQQLTLAEECFTEQTSQGIWSQKAKFLLELLTKTRNQLTNAQN